MAVAVPRKLFGASYGDGVKMDIDIMTKKKLWKSVLTTLASLPLEKITNQYENSYKSRAYF